MYEKPEKSIEDIFKIDGRYPLEAVKLVREGLSYTVSQMSLEGESGGKSTREWSTTVSDEALRSEILAAGYWSAIQK